MVLLSLSEAKLVLVNVAPGAGAAFGTLPHVLGASSCAQSLRTNLRFEVLILRTAK